MIKQTGVAPKHVAVYFDEDVTEPVTSLQKGLKVEPHLSGGEDGEGLGLQSASGTKLFWCRETGGIR